MPGSRSKSGSKSKSRSRSRSRSNNGSGSANNDAYAKQLENAAEKELKAARAAHKAALKALGDARKRSQTARNKADASRRLTKLLKKKEFNNMRKVKELVNNAKNKGVASLHGMYGMRQPTSLAKGNELVTAYNNLLATSKNISNPTTAKRMGRGVMRTLGLASEKNEKISNHNRLERAYERCERLGICTPAMMNRILDQLTSLEKPMTNSEKAREKDISNFVKGMPQHLLINKSARRNMLYKNRHQPRRLRPEVFEKRGKKLRAHSIGDIRNAMKMFSVNTKRNYPVTVSRRGRALPKVIRSIKKKSQRRKSK